MKQYVYIFTRKDLSPEQIAVQSAHVTLQLGFAAGIDKMAMDPTDTYFSLCGVRNLRGLNGIEIILKKFDIPYEVFFEPDLNGGENTSIATYPIDEDQLGPLVAFDWLKI